MKTSLKNYGKMYTARTTMKKKPAKDTIPSYACPIPKCEGNVTLNEEEQVWECDTCEFFVPKED